MQGLALLVSLGVAASNPATAILDVPLYQKALSRDAIYEMHCRGVPVDKAQQRFDEIYKSRQDRLRASLLARHLLNAVEPDEEVIPIGFKCPHYHGAEVRLRSALRQSERLSNINQ
jgi:hypothetical protein